MWLMTTHDDSDWLGTADTLPAPASVPPAPAAGVFRCEAEGEQSTRFATLTEATAEPPMDPEARIIAYTDAGPVLLAESTAHDERVGWRITMPGALRLQREASGRAA